MSAPRKDFKTALASASAGDAAGFTSPSVVAATETAAGYSPEDTAAPDLPAGASETPEAPATLSLVSDLVVERPRRTFGSCAYCGRPCIGPACADHRDLLPLDPYRLAGHGVRA